VPPTQTPQPTHTPVPPTSTRLLSATPVPPTATTQPTQTPGGATATPNPNPTSCAIQFEDVLPGTTFYPFVRCLACKGILGGYACGGAGEPCNPNNDPYFRPGVNVTRGQIAKIVSNAAGFQEDPGAQIFEDVIPTGAFYPFIQRLTHRAVMGGYACGGTNPETAQDEPCVAPGNRPYFRPGNTATRGQVAKIVSNAAGYQEDPGAVPTFEDVPTTNPFYTYIQRLTNRVVMGGYACGGQNPESGQAEPCVAPANRPYFRYGNHITRAQTAKIVSGTFFPNCQIPLR
ncbi:MAG: S-layer homology domain-containing protein, partial [Chloroflexota bacterium]|nr:S-layer homology domain-containing protein [Chloroflexota bacterium]